MKELTIGQKAQRYEEALERARRLKEDPQSAFYEHSPNEGDTICDYIFPELKEGEDDGEKIRKDLITMVRGWKNGHRHWCSDERYCDSIIAWLEKQGKQDERYKYLEELLEADSIYQMAMNDAMVEEAKLKAVNALSKLEVSKLLPKEWTINDDATLKELIDFLENGTAKLQHDLTRYANWLKLHLTPIEKQDKPTDNVGPKFKAGDWIIFNGLTLRVKQVVKGFYLTVSKGGIPNGYGWDIDNAARLWTIQDARDGDVLVCKGDVKHSDGIKYERICLFNNLSNAFFTLTKTSNSVEGYDIDVNVDYPDNTAPATKEQEEILFMVMKNTGYTFDFENKKLKKIGDEEVNGEAEAF